MGTSHSEEITILDTSRELSDKVQRIKAEVPDELKLLSIFVDVFSCFFRFVSAILDEDGVLQEDMFWQRVTVSIQHHLQFSDDFDRFDLFSPTYAHSCLNRLQLANNQQMVNLDDPASALKLAGVSPSSKSDTDSWQSHYNDRLSRSFFYFRSYL